LTSNIGVFANARGSMLMGDETNLLNVSVVVGTATVAVAINEVQKNDVKFIFETQAGAEYILPICGGGYYFARAGVEMQYWDNFGVSPTGLLFDESSGFGGLFAAVGIQR
jgi:hypothetical protein